MSLGLPLPVAALSWRLPTLFRARLAWCGFWPDHRQPCYGRFPWPACRRGHAFAEGGSPVCFAEMPLDNRTVDLLRPSPPVRLTPAALLRCDPTRNDL